MKIYGKKVGLKQLNMPSGFLILTAVLVGYHPYFKYEVTLLLP